MSVASRFNKKNPFTFQVPEDFGYVSLEDLFDENGKEGKYTVHTMFINTKGKFKPHPTVAIDDCLVSFPSHLTETVEEIMKDDEAVAAVNEGKFGFMIRPYQTKAYPDQVFYGVDWIDM